MVSGSEPRGGPWVLAGFRNLRPERACALVRGCRRRRQSDRRPDLHRGLPVLGARRRRHRPPRDLRTRRVRRPAWHTGLSHEPHAPDSTQAIVVRPRSMGRHCRVGRRAGALVETIGPRRTSSLRRRARPTSGARGKTTGAPPCLLRQPGLGLLELALAEQAHLTRHHPEEQLKGAPQPAEVADDRDPLPAVAMLDSQTRLRPLGPPIWISGPTAWGRVAAGRASTASRSGGTSTST